MAGRGVGSPGKRKFHLISYTLPVSSVTNVQVIIEMRIYRIKFVEIDSIVVEFLK